MKTVYQFLIAGCMTLGMQTAFAGPANIAYARVVNVKPVYERVERRTPAEQCWVETVAVSHQDSGKRATPVVLGSIIGGALGHAVGHGHSNKKVGTAVGAVLGAAVGSDLERSNRRPSSRHVEYRDVERCEYREQVSTFEQLVGYDVIYQYSGQRYTTRTQNHPGDRIKVAVDVRPVEY